MTQSPGWKRLAVVALTAVSLGASTAAQTEESDTAPNRAPARPQQLVDPQGRLLPVLLGGWYLWNPYQFVDPRGGPRVEATIAELTGLDVEMSWAVASAAGFAVDYAYRPWLAHVAQLRTGEADIASGAIRTAEQAEFVHYSIPYRQSTTVLYVRRGEARGYRFSDVAGMLDTFRGTGVRVGVVGGLAYADPAVNDYLADPVNARRIVTADNDYEGLRNLVERRADVLLADRLSGAAAAWRGGWRNQVDVHPIRFSADVHFMFSKATVSPDVVARFDDAIRRLEATGEIRRMVSNYLFPVLLEQILDSQWFFAFDVIGTVAFALSGVLIAYRERYSLLGALVLAALPAVGGGTVRDLLVGRDPPAVLASPFYLSLVGATVLGGFLATRGLAWARRRGWPPSSIEALGRHRGVRDLYEVSDALGIAAFTVTGVAVAISARLDPLWLWAPLLAMLTAAGGGMLRDLVRQAGKIASLHRELYAEVPLLWGLVLAGYLSWQGPLVEPDRFVYVVLITMAGAFATRMVVVFRGVRSPGFSPTSDES